MFFINLITLEAKVKFCNYESPSLATNHSKQNFSEQKKEKKKSFST